VQLVGALARLLPTHDDLVVYGDCLLRGAFEVFLGALGEGRTEVVPAEEVPLGFYLFCLVHYIMIGREGLI
jgi:hypothetical protein